MASENLDIYVNEFGSLTVKKRIQDIGTSAGGSRKEVSLLQRTLGILGIGFVARELVQLNDEFITIQNRLRVVTTGTQELARVQEELLGVANRTRTSLQGTAELYTRMKLSLDALGQPTQDLTKVTESLNQAIILSGAGAREAENALIQLAQGISSNRLGGDELRSVLEQLPVVADVIAKKMKVTRGGLRKLGREGKIDAEIIIDAFRDAREELAERFGVVVPTIAQKLQIVRNNFISVLGEIEGSIGIFTKLGNALTFVAEHMQTLLTVATVLASFMAGQLVGALLLKTWGLLITAINGATVALSIFRRGLQLLGAIALQNPIGVAIGGFVAIGLAVVALADPIRDLTDSVADFFVGVGKSVGEFVTSLYSIEDANTPLKQTIFYVKKLKPAIMSLPGAMELLKEETKLTAAESKKLFKIYDSMEERLIPILKSARRFAREQEVTMALMKAGAIDADEAFDRLGRASDEFNKIKSIPVKKAADALDVFRANYANVSEEAQVYDKINDLVTEGLKTGLIPSTEAAAEITAELKELYQNSLDPLKKYGLSMDQVNKEVEKATPIAVLLARADKDLFAAYAKGKLTWDQYRAAMKLYEDQLRSARRGTSNFREEILSLRDSFFPVIEANREFTKQQRNLNKAVRRGIFSQEEAAAILGKMAIAYRDIELVVGDAIPKAEVLRAAQEELNREYKAGIINLEGYAAGLAKLDSFAASKGLSTEVPSAGEIKPPTAALDVNNFTLLQKHTDEYLQLVKALGDEVETTLDPAMETYNAQQARLNEAFELGVIDIKTYNQLLGKNEEALVRADIAAGSLANQWEIGVTDAINNFGKSATDVMGALDTLGQNVFSGLEDAVVNFVATGKFEIKGFVDQALKDLTRLLIRMSLFSLAGGDVPLFQHGGRFTVGGQGRPG